MFASGCGAAFVLLALGRAGAEAGVGAVQLELSPMNAETSARAPAAGEDLVHWRGQLWIARESPARESPSPKDQVSLILHYRLFYTREVTLWGVK